jgi:hypothetical protein
MLIAEIHNMPEEDVPIIVSVMQQRLRKNERICYRHFLGTLSEITAVDVTHDDVSGTHSITMGLRDLNDQNKSSLAWEIPGMVNRLELRRIEGGGAYTWQLVDTDDDQSFNDRYQ